MRRNVEKIGFLFDLDGVIINSESEYTRIWAQINSEFPTGIDNFEKVIKGCTLTKILNDNYNDDYTRESVKLRLHELEEQMHYDYLPNAKEFLILLKDSGFASALVTSSDDKKMSHLREELPELFDFFDFIVTGSLVVCSKPSPEGYLLGAEKIQRNPKNCVVFEDSLQGVMAGRNSGAYVVGVSGTIPAEKLNPYCDFMIDHFGQIDFDNLIQILFDR